MSRNGGETARRYRLIVEGFHTAASLRRTARFLSRVFRERSEADIAASLAHLPVLLATNLDLSSAETLRRHLQWHGAHVRLAPDAPRPKGTSEGGTGVSGASDRRSGTTYRKPRPGIKERVYASHPVRPADYSR